jgi:hypothetical protein
MEFDSDILKGLERHQHIKKATFTSTFYPPPSWEDLESCIRNNKSVEDWNLSFNNFGDKGVYSVIKALEKNSTVRFVDLSGYLFIHFLLFFLN